MLLHRRMIDGKETFDQFLSRLDPRLPSTVERHERLRVKLIRFFRWRECDDVEDLADETIARLAKNLARGESISNPSAYVYAIALNVFREYLRRPKPTQVPEGWEPLSEPPSAFSDCAKHCFGSLPDDKRSLLERYYSDEERRAELASELNTSVGALRLRIHRIRTEIRACYKKCMESRREV